MDSGNSSGSQLRCIIRWCRRKQEEKEPAEQRSSAHTSPLAPYAIVSSTNSKAQAPNLDDAREAFPTASATRLHLREAEPSRAAAPRPGDGSAVRSPVDLPGPRY